MKRKALGKGLRSLIPQTPPRTSANRQPEVRTDAGESLLQIDIDRISPNRNQPRSDFEDQQLDELAQSLKAAGVLQPVVVRPRDDGGFELIAGERRWRAAQRAGLLKIPAVVRKVEDDRMRELALIENIQRKDLNPIEEARAYEVLLGEMKLSQGEVAKRVGRDRSSIANLLRLLKLPEKIQNCLSAGLLSVGHAKVIMALPDAGTQIRVADEVVARLLSVRETETLVSGLMVRGKPHPGTEASGRSRRPGGSDDPNVRAAAERLGRALATKVRIVKRGKRGKIEIEFYSDEELERFYGILMTAERRQ